MQMSGIFGWLICWGSNKNERRQFAKAEQLIFWIIDWIRPLFSIFIVLKQVYVYLGEIMRYTKHWRTVLVNLGYHFNTIFLQQ